MEEVMLKYDELGKGLPVVLLHGFPLCRQMWAPQMAALADAGYRVICPDLPGFGESSSLSHPASMPRYADSVIDLLDELGIDQAVVGGMSMGGYVLLDLVERYPKRLPGAMFLVTPVLFAEETSRKNPRLILKVRQWVEAAPSSGLIGGLLAMRERDDAVDKLPGFTLPSLVIGAEQDLAVPLEHSRLLAQGLPNSRLTIIPGAGHMANLEQPELFSAALLDFLASLS
jgi:pimeloyl-ACP methyl ester carboxylesterase